MSGAATANSLDNCEQTVPLKESLNEEHDNEQLQMSYHAQQGKSDTTENRPRKQATYRRRNSLKRNTIYMGKNPDKTAKSVGVFEQLSRDKIAISDRNTEL